MKYYIINHRSIYGNRDWEDYVVTSVGDIQYTPAFSSIEAAQEVVSSVDKEWNRIELWVDFKIIELEETDG